MNVHEAWELKKMQSLPLEEKIRMTQDRIKAWYDAWTRFEIYNKETGKTRFVTMDMRDRSWAEPPLKDCEYVQEAWPGAVYVSFSGGKDSTVLKHIVDGMYDDVPSLFVNTGLEYPEIQKFAMSQKNVVTVRPKMRFDEVIKKYGYPAVSKDISNCIFWARRGSPSRLARVMGTNKKRDGSPSMFNCTKWAYLLDAPFEVGSDCCKIMKKDPSKKYEKETGRKPMLGLMADESIKRRDAWMKTGCNAFDLNRPQSQPKGLGLAKSLITSE